MVDFHLRIQERDLQVKSFVDHFHLSERDIPVECNKQIHYPMD